MFITLRTLDLILKEEVRRAHPATSPVVQACVESKQSFAGENVIYQSS
jgi:hypothetical protein